MNNNYDIKTYRDLAVNAIEDLKNYAHDGNGTRLLVSHDSYRETLYRLDTTRPAAQVEGLETVAWQQITPGIGWAPCGPHSRADKTRELVTRSNAESIIAAEREKYDTLFTTWTESRERHLKAEADNAALTARVKVQDQEISDQSDLIASLEAKLAAAREDVKLLDALKDESWDLRCFDIPTGSGDADIGWRVVGHWLAKPHERTVAEVYEDNPRAAIHAALGEVRS